MTYINFILDHIDDRPRERKLFLCLLLGYYIILRREEFYELSDHFPSGLLLDALDCYKQKNFSSDIKILMRTAITTLIQHNAFQYQFHWLKRLILNAFFSSIA